MRGIKETDLSPVLERFEGLATKEDLDGLKAHPVSGGPLVDGGAQGRHSMYDLMTASAASALIALP